MFLFTCNNNKTSFYKFKDYLFAQLSDKWIEARDLHGPRVALRCAARFALLRVISAKLAFRAAGDSCRCSREASCQVCLAIC